LDTHNGRPADTGDLKRTAEDDGSGGPKKKRKSVSFKPEKELVEVRYFESGEDEVRNIIMVYGLWY
jgi:hypothetical protein